MKKKDENEGEYCCHRCTKPTTEEEALVLRPDLLRRRLIKHLPLKERAKFWISSTDMVKFIMCGECGHEEAREYGNERVPPVLPFTRTVAQMRKREDKAVAEARVKADTNVLAFEVLVDRKLEVTEEQMMRLVRHHLEARPAAEGERACPRCGCAIRPDKAWVPSLDSIGNFLARRVKADDLPDFALCGTCGNFLREIAKVATFRYLDTRGLLERNEAADDFERQVAMDIAAGQSKLLSAPLGVIAGVKVEARPRAHGKKARRAAAA